MALTAPLVRPGRRALPGKQAETATMERSAPRVLRDRKDLPVRMDPMDLQVRLGHKGRQEGKALRVQEVPKDPPELTAATDRQVQLDPKVRPDHKGPTGLKVKQDQLVVL